MLAMRLGQKCQLEVIGADSYIPFPSARCDPHNDRFTEIMVKDSAQQSSSKTGAMVVKK
jgi:hypothetical protein